VDAAFLPYFVDNEVRLLLFVSGLPFGETIFGRLCCPVQLSSLARALTTLREKLIKIGAKVVTHAEGSSSRWQR